VLFVSEHLSLTSNNNNNNNDDDDNNNNNNNNNTFRNQIYKLIIQER
jgi:hypothetical protein